MPDYNEALKKEYQNLYDTCSIKASKYAATDKIIDNLLTHKNRYEAVAEQSKIPWYFIAIVHHLECSQNFNKHLHNGDPLSKRTTHVPKNRPLTGKPPFTWEQSALDALTLQGLTTWTDWSLPGLLFKLEAYSGFGYRRSAIKIPSPYLWSFSNHYSKGKFVSDGRYNYRTTSQQCGAAVLLHRLEERQIISLSAENKLQQIKALCATVRFAPTKVVDDALRLQSLLNAVGYPLRLDGKAGERTSNVCKKITGNYLTGDPRQKKA